jgi:catechol 2,3-dioxygenase-like lactoylglutathione lyase family enzyme
MTGGSRSGVVLFAQDVGRLVEFYSTVLGLHVTGRGEDHVVLESPGFQLVVHEVPPGRATPVDIAVPPTRRAMAAIKPVFFVESLTRVRTAAGLRGGLMESEDQEWSFQGMTVCDGLDPEGNVIQFREDAGHSEDRPCS